MDARPRVRRRAIRIHISNSSPSQRPTGPRRPMTGSNPDCILGKQPGLLRRLRLRSPSYGGQVAPCNDKELRSRGTNARVMHRRLPLEGRRGQGTPDAGRTRETCVQRKLRFAHASDNRAAETTGIPCAMVLTLIRDLPGVPGFLATITLRNVAQGLIPASGDQDHTISRPHRPRSSYAPIRPPLPRRVSWRSRYALQRRGTGIL
jgi:hypothetical protein